MMPRVTSPQAGRAAAAVPSRPYIHRRAHAVAFSHALSRGGHTIRAKNCCPCASLGRHRARATIVECAPRYNPQNVDQPLVVPHRSLTALDSVTTQLEALKRNDEPWTNHGLQTCYEFGEDVGGMEMSEYFGFKKDLYHFDHFMGLFGTRLGALVDLKHYDVLDEVLTTGGTAGSSSRVVLRVQVTDGRGGPAGTFVFTQVQRQLGTKKGCWMTKSILQEAST